MGYAGRRIDKLLMKVDHVFCQLQDCSLVLLHARSGEVLVHTDLKPGRAGGLPSIQLDVLGNQIIAHGNHTINVWGAGTCKRVYNTDLVIGQVRW